MWIQKSRAREREVRIKEARNHLSVNETMFAAIIHCRNTSRSPTPFTSVSCLREVFSFHALVRSIGDELTLVSGFFAIMSMKQYPISNTNTPRKYVASRLGVPLKGVANISATRCADGLSTNVQTIVAVRFIKMAIGLLQETARHGFRFGLSRQSSMGIQAQIRIADEVVVASSQRYRASTIHSYRVVRLLDQTRDVPTRTSRPVTAHV